MKKVLIIEDDPTVAQIYRVSFENHGYAVETCPDGQSGLGQAQDDHPDVILLDLMLPRMNGIDFLKTIRAQRAFASIPIIVLTNAYLTNMIQEAFSAGASQVFNKAEVTPRHILDALDQLLNGGKVVINAASLCSPSLPAVPEEHPGTPPPPGNHGYNDQPAGLTASPSERLTPARAEPFAKTSDTASQEIHQAFLDAHAQTLAVLRKLVQDVISAGDALAREPLLLELYRRIHALTGGAGIAGFPDIAQMAAVLEVLLKELLEQPMTVNPSTLRTLNSSVEFIGELFALSPPRSYALPPARILIVDDERLSRRAIIYALRKAHLNLEAADEEDPTVGLQMASNKAYDLIFLDVQMPHLNGFELCSKIHSHPFNKNTPIIFVTALSDFTNRAKSTVCGGSDLIAKPFLFVELALKTITILLRSRLSSNRKVA